MNEMDLFKEFHQELKQEMNVCDFHYVEESLKRGELVAWFSWEYLLKCAHHPLLALCPDPHKAMYNKPWTLETLQGTWQNLTVRFSLEDECLYLTGGTDKPIEKITLSTPDCSVDKWNQIITVLI